MQVCRLASSAGGVYTESVTKERSEAKITEKRRKAKKLIQERNGNDKTKRKGKTENVKRETEKRNGKGRRKTGKRERNMRDVGTGAYRKARVPGRHYANPLGVNGGDASWR